MYKTPKLIITVALIGICLVGCRQPYHEPVLVDIEPHEIPFLANLEEKPSEDSQSTLSDEERRQLFESQLVNRRRIEIAHRWKDTGRNTLCYVIGWNGKWIPIQDLILVDTSPETVEWDADPNGGTSTKDQAIWAESSDSVGFSTGITLTAEISTNADGVTFLTNYPPRSTKQIRSADGTSVVMEVPVTTLKDVLDKEVRGVVLAEYSTLCAGYNMDELRTKKVEIMEAVESAVLPYCKERGITVTNIGQYGGFTYENVQIQESIDAVFQAQQDEEVAKAEGLAAEQRKVALKLTGEGEAAQILEARRGEAEGIKLVADAKQYELEVLESNPDVYMELKKLELEEKRLEAWDGKYPYYYMGGGGETPELLMQMPAPK